MQQEVSRYDHRVQGFCCMTNHVHLLIQVADEPLSKIMQNLSFRYTRWINKHQKRMGYLFQGRFKVILIDADEHFLERNLSSLSVAVKKIEEGKVESKALRDKLRLIYNSICQA